MIIMKIMYGVGNKHLHRWMDILNMCLFDHLKLCNFIFKDNILYLNETTENQIFR